MKTIRIFFFTFFFAFCYPYLLKAQTTVDSVLREIERNSSTLQAFKQQAEAVKLENHTGIYPANPSVDVAYMWGRPSAAGNRIDFSAVQSFDFPTAYTYRARVADGNNLIADHEYERRRRELLLQASALCVELIYRNRLGAELQRRLQHAQKLAAACQERFSMGNTDVLERNKSKLNLLNVRKTFETNEIERMALLSELQRLNGGQAIEFESVDYPLYLLPQDFEQWYEQAQANNPTLQIMSREVEVSRNKEKLSRALALPKFSAGYTSETVVDVAMRGVAVGVTIPLWEHKNTVKHAKAQTLAWEHIETDAKLQCYNTLKTQHRKALNLHNMLSDYSEMLQTTGNPDLLWKSLELGKLSLIEYFIELSVYYEATDNILQAERDYRLAISRFQDFMIP